MIFAMLDFRTLSHISRTCLRGIVVVDSLPEHRDLMRYAPRALAALAKTRLIHHFPAATVHGALLSADCISCNNFGPFLFLPTCERCCYHCLCRVQGFWVIPISMAKKCFGLSATGAKTLPILHSVPGKYYVKHMISRKRSLRLVCVGAAKTLAIAEGSSEERMTQELELKRIAGLPLKEYYTMRFLLRPPVKPPRLELFVHPTQAEVPSDMYCGMASIPFPYLGPSNGIEHGLWCLGCELVSRKWSRNDPFPDHLSHLLLPGCLADDIVYNMQEVARSKAEFQSHILSCPGAKALIEQSSSIVTAMETRKPKLNCASNTQ